MLTWREQLAVYKKSMMQSRINELPEAQQIRFNKIFKGGVSDAEYAVAMDLIDRSIAAEKAKTEPNPESAYKVYRRIEPADALGYKCQECGRKFRTAGAARSASRRGCPKCGGCDIDLNV